MALYNEEHVATIKQGREAWTDYRKQHPLLSPDLWGADFRGADLAGFDLNSADLTTVDFTGANLRGANLCSVGSNAGKFIGADLTDADLSESEFMGVKFHGANLTRVNFEYSVLQQSEFQDAILHDCRVYGTSAWDLNMEGAHESNLIIQTEPLITVDHLEIAQFIYLLLNNQKIRDVIDTITSKTVLILGRFTPERKAVLDQIREALRSHNLVPMLFDFERPGSRSFIETVSTLAHLAKFVIADLTDAKIVLDEVPQIVRNIAVPVVPIMLKDGEPEPVTLEDLRRNQRSLLETVRYANVQDLIANLDRDVIAPASSLAEQFTRGTERTCVNCGEQLVMGAAYCSRCGAKCN